MTGQRSNSGRSLQKEWSIPAKHVLYHHEGAWFHRLEQFPGALCDSDGYVLFVDQQAFETCPQLRIRAHVRAPDGLKNILGYVRKK